MYRTDDPIADFNRHQEDMERRLEQRPRCSQCDEHIQEEFCFEINGELICEGCMKMEFRKLTTDFM